MGWAWVTVLGTDLEACQSRFECVLAWIQGLRDTNYNFGRESGVKDRFDPKFRKKKKSGKPSFLPTIPVVSSYRSKVAGEKELLEKKKISKNLSRRLVHHRWDAAVVCWLAAGMRASPASFLVALAAAASAGVLAAPPLSSREELVGAAPGTSVRAADSPSRLLA
ncbi:hypothetical protein Scep_025506 [Stephania cephalantha]|uniref:Uncharacterized protein n=1 Tax=Stephania cephalantha TaxID=152367 RepID=A0AAP0ENL4_9MAGN